MKKQTKVFLALALVLGALSRTPASAQVTPAQTELYLIECYRPADCAALPTQMAYADFAAFIRAHHKIDAAVLSNVVDPNSITRRGTISTMQPTTLQVSDDPEKRLTSVLQHGLLFTVIATDDAHYTYQCDEAVTGPNPYQPHGAPAIGSASTSTSVTITPGSALVIHPFPDEPYVFAIARQPAPVHPS